MQKSMRVAFYATTILEHGGGLEKYLIETARNLSGFLDVQVDIITMDNAFTEKIARILGFYYFKKIDKTLLYKESPESVSERLGQVKYYKCKDFIELTKKLGEYDIVYSKNELLEAFIWKFFVGYKNVPSITFGCHTPVYYPVTNSVQSKLHNFLYNGFVYKWLANGVKAFHVTNEFDKILLEKLFPKRKVFKIYNPFNTLQFNKNLKEYVFDFTFDTSKYNILWIARLTEQKGVRSFMHIIDEVNKTNMREKVVFNIVGSGDLEDEIVKMKEKWDNINWFGYVEYRYLPSIYNQNNLFISTSKWEAFGLNILEAQAIGLPVIAFDIPGPQDIISDKKSGFLVANESDFRDRIMETVNTGELFDRGAIETATIRNFDPREIYMKLVEMFASVVENNFLLK